MGLYRWTWLVAASAAVLVFGCESQECVGANDCFRGEVCVEAVCVESTPEYDQGHIATNDASGDAAIAQDVRSPDLGVRDSGAVDMGQTDLAGPDTGLPDQGPAGPACVVDPFAACTDVNEDDGSNNSWPDAYQPWSSVGCKGNARDEVTPLQSTVSGRICTLEPADWYGLTVVGCDTKTLVLEVRLDPDENHLECTAELAQLELKHGGADVPCDGGRFGIQCSTDGDSNIARLRLDPIDSLYSFQIGVSKPGGMDVQYDYDLSVVVYE